LGTFGARAEHMRAGDPMHERTESRHEFQLPVRKAGLSQEVPAGIRCCAPLQRGWRRGGVRHMGAMASARLGGVVRRAAGRQLTRRSSHSSDRHLVVPRRAEPVFTRLRQLRLPFR
jgi:hypothetical protein